MKWRRFFSIVLVMIIFSRCGNDSRSSTEPISKKPTTEPLSLNIKDIWSVASKKCGDTALDLKSMEVYKLDNSHLVRVERISEDDAILCKIGYVYDRIIGSWEHSENIYKESAVLKSAAAKKTCWKKQNGTPVTPPIRDEIVSFEPEQAESNMTGQADSLSVQIRNGKECPLSILYLELRKK